MAAAAPTPKLYYTSTSCGAANFIVGHIGGVKFDSEQVDLATHKTASGRNFYEVNPKGNVPTVVLPDGSILNENIATLTFLADNGNANLAPKEGSIERYKYLSVLSFVATELHKGVGGLFNRGLNDEGRAAQKTVALSKIDILVRDYLKNGERKYIYGDHLSAADIYAYIVLSWHPFVGIELPAGAKAYFEHIKSLDAVQKAHAAIAAAPAAGH